MLIKSVLLKDCYVDEDCPTKQVCRGGSCQERLSLIKDLDNVRSGWLSSFDFTLLLCFYIIRLKEINHGNKLHFYFTS